MICRKSPNMRKLSNSNKKNDGLIYNSIIYLEHERQKYNS